MAAAQWFGCFLTILAMRLSLLFRAAAAVFHFRTHALYCSWALNTNTQTHTLCACHLHILDLGAKALIRWTVNPTSHIIYQRHQCGAKRQPRKFTFPATNESHSNAEWHMHNRCALFAYLQSRTMWSKSCKYTAYFFFFDHFFVYFLTLFWLFSIKIHNCQTKNVRFFYLIGSDSGIVWGQAMVKMFAQRYLCTILPHIRIVLYLHVRFCWSVCVSIFLVELKFINNTLLFSFQCSDCPSNAFICFMILFLLMLQKKWKQQSHPFGFHWKCIHEEKEL